MNNKKLFITIVLFLLLVPFVNAITGTIGNAKAIVKVDLSKSNILERTVLVRNVNNITLNIKLEPSDDLELITEIIDKEFELKPNEEKKARFKVNIPKEGTYNGNIVVFFNPPEGKGAGVVLQSNLIINAVGEGSEIETKEDKIDVKPEEKTDNKITSSVVLETDGLENISPSIILFIVLISVVVISGFVVLMRRI